MIPAQDIGQTVKNTVLEAARAGLERQLVEATREQASLHEQLRVVRREGDRAAIQQRLGQVEQRMSRLQSSIDEVAAQQAQSSSPAITAPPPPLPPGRRDIGDGEMVLGIMGILFIGFPLAIAFSRIVWRRTSLPQPQPVALGPDSTRRFDQLEQAVDAIAIEVERISENQRYLTKLLSEPRQTDKLSS